MRPHRILGIIAMSCALSAHATTYYVAPPASGGSNSNSGTIGSPWATIDYGVDQLTPGDKLYVRGGTYNEAITLWNKYGTSTALVEVAEYPNETAIIDGTGTTAGAVVAIGGGSTYVSFRRFTVRNGPSTGVFIYGASHVDVLDNTVHGNGEFGIAVRTPTAESWGTTNNILIKGNYVYDNCRTNASRTAGSWKQGISAWRADYVTITENDVYENYGEGIDYILSDHGTITKNEVYDNFSVNIYLDNAQSTLVDSNSISCSNSNYYRDGEAAGGVGVANETYTEYGQNMADGLTISNNIVLRCHSGFTYWDGEYNNGMHNSTVAHNVFYNTGYALVWIRGGSVHTNVLVANNILYQKYNKPYASSSGTTGVTYQYNNWYGGGDSSTIITGSGDITTDPKLVSAGGSSDTDYQLQSTSPCINTGTNISAVTKDFWGTTRTNPPSIGIHEY